MKSQVMLRLPQERLPAPCQHPASPQEQGPLQASCRDPKPAPVRGRGREAGQRRDVMGKGRSERVANKAAETSHSTASSDSAAADRFGSFPPYPSVLFFNNQHSGSRRQPALLQSSRLHCHQYQLQTICALKMPRLPFTLISLYLNVFFFFPLTPHKDFFVLYSHHFKSDF